MHPGPLFLLVFAAVATAHSSALPPRHHRHLPLPLRLHQKEHDVPVSLHKRDILQDLFCGIGLLSSCPEGTTPPPSTPSVDMDSDPNNCGRLGNVCPSPFANGIGTGSCQLGTCVTSCPTGFTYTANGCVDTRADTNNCGAVGRTCPASYANGEGSVCVSGECRPVSCDEGYTFEQGGTACEPVEEGQEPTTTESPTSSATPSPTSDPSSTTAEPSATPSSSADAPSSSPSSDSSSSSSSPSGDSSPAAPSISARARARLLRQRSLSHPRTLCPSGLTACPISGSSSFLLAQSSLLASAPVDSPLASGFECLDTTHEVESCGGCSALGEGKNCLEIEGAKSVGCGEGRCVVFACAAGYKPDEDARRCVRVKGKKAHHHQHGGNHTRLHRH